ncbi:MAG: sugar ABC transporter substrate-binding protein [Chloroflexota bacterium]
MKQSRVLLLSLVFPIVLGVMVSCGPAKTAQSEVTLWFHGGTAEETGAMKAQIERFNTSQKKYKVVMTEIPGGAVAGSGYNDSVNAAAVAGKLPDILDLDGPNLYNYAWAGFLKDLTNAVSPELKADLLPSLIQQGTYKGKLYAIGQYDSGLALAGRKSMLQKAEIRIPKNVEEAWTMDEFKSVLDKFKALQQTEYVIDLKMNYGAGEWLTYAFSPIIEGFGGDLINRTTYLSADGVLNSPESVAAMKFFQSLFTQKLANLTPADDNDFVNGKTVLGFCGHWMTTPYYKAFMDDFVLIPMPNWGKRAVTGMGSWAWSISSQTKNFDGAWAFFQFMLQPDEILSITNINGAVPGRITALNKTDLYKEDGRLAIFAEQLKTGVAVPRPVTPAYPAITAAFYTAADAIAKGGDVKAELDKAVDKIDKDIKNNDGYPEK